MSELVERLLAEVSSDAPCGPNLEYDEEFVALGVAATPVPERRMGTSVKPAEEPKWRDVLDKAAELLGRSKDIRIAVMLTRGLVGTDGWAGLADGLLLVRSLLERYWEGVHPMLEGPNGDPTYRLNVLADLADREWIIPKLRTLPLVTSRDLGSYGLRDVAIASGELQVPVSEDEPPPTMELIEGAFQNAEPERVEATHAAVRQALEHIEAIDAICVQRTKERAKDDAQGRTAELEDLRAVLKGAERMLAQRPAGSGAPAAAEEVPMSSPMAGTSVTPAAAAPPGEIRSREDVVRLLDRACQYYRRHEPSSPVPLLLERAKRLVSKNYLEITGDLAPGALSEVEKILGSEKEGS